MRIKLKSSQFADYAIAFLYDKLNNMDDVVPYQVNEDFDDLAEVLRRKGCRTIFLQYWLHMNPQLRVRYRMTRDTFRIGKTKGNTLIEIVPDEVPESMKEPPKGFFKKVGRLLKKFLMGEFNEEEPTKKKM